jgi:hypothetical protein
VAGVLALGHQGVNPQSKITKIETNSVFFFKAHLSHKPCYISMADYEMTTQKDTETINQNNDNEDMILESNHISIIIQQQKYDKETIMLYVLAFTFHIILVITCIAAVNELNHFLK